MARPPRGVVDAESFNKKVISSKNGFDNNAEYKDGSLTTSTDEVTKLFEDMEIKYSGDRNGLNHSGSTNEHTEYIEIDKTSQNLIVMVVGTGSFRAQVKWDSIGTPMITPPPNGEPLDIVMSANYGQEMQTLTIEPTPSDTKTLGIDKAALDPLEEAIKAIATLDFALDKVDGYRGYYGSMENRFDSAINNLAQNQLNTSAAQSRIQDADYAIETANLARAQILQQTSTTILAQANQQQELALALLRQ